MKLFVYENTWSFISIAKIHMQELKKSDENPRDEDQIQTNFQTE